MKNINLLASLLLLFLASSCGKAPEPINQALNKGHGEPAKIEMIFTAGNLSQESIISKAYLVAGFEADAAAQDLVFVGKYNEENKFVTTGGVSLSKGKWYRLRVNFYNATGQLINSQFLTPEQQKMHQFFFRTYESYNEDEGRYMKQNKKLIDYKYGDTDDSGKLLDLPVGFLGYFYIKPDVSLEQIVERVTLAHVTPPASKLNDEGVPYKFDSPSRRLMGVTDIDIRVDIKINH